MNAQACGAGDNYQWPYPHYPYVPYGAPGMPLQQYGTTTAIGTALTEDRIREIIREELKAALEALRDPR